jgi:hypothetical protein
MFAVLERHRQAVWVGWLIGALLFLESGNPLVYGIAVPLSAGILVMLTPGLVPVGERRVDRRDLIMVLTLYGGVVASLTLATRSGCAAGRWRIWAFEWTTGAGHWGLAWPWRPCSSG